MTASLPISIKPLPTALLAEITAQSEKTVAADFSILVDAVVARFNTALDAVILYGSCLHSCDLDEGIADLYVIVDSYRNAYSERHLSYLNAWLPPNVFYLEVSHQGKTLRAKYAVISTTDFEQGAQYWFHPYIWARFAQPSRLLYARNEISRQRIYHALAHAVITFLRTGIEAQNTCTIDIEEIWTRCLALTYAAELRPERETRARYLAHMNLDNFTQLTAAAKPVLVDILEIQSNGHYRCLTSTATRRRARWHWRLRRWQGRILSILRLTKASLTFRDCLDYAAWKIERHTGIHIEITPMLRRYPVLWGYKVMWQLLRRGILR